MQYQSQFIVVHSSLYRYYVGAYIAIAEPAGISDMFYLPFYTLSSFLRAPEQYTECRWPERCRFLLHMDCVLLAYLERDSLGRSIGSIPSTC